MSTHAGPELSPKKLVSMPRGAGGSTHGKVKSSREVVELMPLTVTVTATSTARATAGTIISVSITIVARISRCERIGDLLSSTTAYRSAHHQHRDALFTTAR